jgi:aryl-alcohol dehydrogenase-like predicted oxidoreductase
MSDNVPSCTVSDADSAQIYSNGESERILGKAIKQHNLPRDEIVVLTKVVLRISYHTNAGLLTCYKLCGPLSDTVKEVVRYHNADEYGYVNQYGLSRKVIES